MLRLTEDRAARPRQPFQKGILVPYLDVHWNAERKTFCTLYPSCTITEAQLESSAAAQKMFLAVNYLKAILASNFEKPEEPMIILPGLIFLAGFIVISLIVVIAFLTDPFDIVTTIFCLLLFFMVAFFCYRRIVLSIFHLRLVKREHLFAKALTQPLPWTVQTFEERAAALGFHVAIGYKASFIRFFPTRPISGSNMKGIQNPWTKPLFL